MDGRKHKRWNALLESHQKMREQRDRMLGELMTCRAMLQETRQQVVRLERQLERRDGRYDKLLKKFEQLQEALRTVSAERALARDSSKPAMPAWAKPNVKAPAKTPGQKAGHVPAHRPAPATIDQHIEVPVPRDSSGKASCPKCRAQLSEVKKHRRIVEDLVPAQKLVRCYHTVSGYCPGCRCIVESRASEQPPAPPGVDLPQSQLGLGALVTAALLRVQYRLPFRKITELLSDLSGLPVSSGGVARQMQKLSRWLAVTYERIKVLIRASPVVNVDETGWRVNGHNTWLWTAVTDQHALYHADKSRGRKVIEDLLGSSFSGTLVSDFYGGYTRYPTGNKQKCLAHLLRNLKETAEGHLVFAKGQFYKRSKEVIHTMIQLKKDKPGMAEDLYESQARHLEARLKALADYPWKEPHARRLAKRLRTHDGTLTEFLWDDQIPPTNNAAERALRPAVVARKISGGSRSDQGANATAILLSILRTANQQNQPLVETLSTLLKAHWAGTNPALLTDTFANLA
jgi:transposase